MRAATMCAISFLNYGDCGAPVRMDLIEIVYACVCARVYASILRFLNLTYLHTYVLVCG